MTSFVAVTLQVSNVLLEYEMLVHMPVLMYHSLKPWFIVNSSA